jgi:hypothetical protein
VTRWKNDGAGLSAYSAKLITTVLKEKISLFSDEDLGTTITITFPENHNLVFKERIWTKKSLSLKVKTQE